MEMFFSKKEKGEEEKKKEEEKSRYEKEGWSLVRVKLHENQKELS